MSHGSAILTSSFTILYCRSLQIGGCLWPLQTIGTLIITVHDYSAVLLFLLPPLSLVYKKIQYWRTLSDSRPEAVDA